MSMSGIVLERPDSKSYEGIKTFIVRSKNFLLGYSDFKPDEEIKAFIVHSKNFDQAIENAKNAQALLIFETRRQHTWLVSTENRLYCVLDDVERGGGHINWSMSKDEIVSGNKINLKLSTREKSHKTGLVDIGEAHTNWLYSKGLFRRGDIIGRINELITKKMM